MAQKDFPSVFADLKALLTDLKEQLIVKADSDENFYLECPGDPFGRGNPHLFGSTTIRKNYVSYHLMPVYTNPELLEGMSESLKKRMQGKSCFNFKKTDPELFEELKNLTLKGFETYKKVGYVI